MAHTGTELMPAVPMNDELGIVYLIETPQQFWSELEDVLKLPSNEYQTLTLLDAALKRFLAFCTAYHGTCAQSGRLPKWLMAFAEQYLQSPLQLEHAFEMLLNSELFEFHSERMCDIIVDDTRSNTDPHSQFISYNVLYWYGKRKPDFLRSPKRWLPLLPLLMDHVLVDIDPDVEDTYSGTVGTSNGIPSIPVPIEAKLRAMSVKLLYEVCRVQKFSLQDLRVFDDDFIDHLFDLVEQTRNMQDDTFNYSVIKLIASLNEQFMVASLPSDPSHHTDISSPETKNRVLRVLMRRLGFSKTFGENMIFMLNRAKHTPEDLCMQLLILKILYLIFTTKGTSEYFYTNDLCVLVDVFLRELADLDDDSESLRHNYLRVLHPLLTKTQLRDYPYKRPQVLYTLESLLSNSKIRDINPTTKRLVERCLSGAWCVQLREHKAESAGQGSDSNSETSGCIVSPQHEGPTADRLERSSSKGKTLKSSKSVENLKIRRDEPRPPLPSLDRIRRTSNSSATSLPAVIDSKPVPNVPKRRGTAGSAIVGGTHAHRHHERVGSHGAEHDFHTHHHQLLAPVQPPQSQHLQTKNQPPPPSPVQTRTASPLISPPSPTSTTSSASDQGQSRPRRRPPPAPPARRKPPAVPVGKTNSGATITVIRSSEIAATPLVKAATPNHSSNLQQSTIF